MKAHLNGTVIVAAHEHDLVLIGPDVARPSAFCEDVRAAA